jgi:hypothetical protein
MHVQYECSFSQSNLKLMNIMTVVHCILCTAIEPRHDHVGTARHAYLEALYTASTTIAYARWTSKQILATLN